MVHAFRLGPLSPGPPPSFAYAAALPTGKLEIRFGPADAPGLLALREALGEQPITCEPALGEAAGTLGLEVAPLPPEALRARAQLAYELASGIDHGASRPEAIAAFLKAAGAYWSSKAWELIAPEEELHVAFAVGRALLQGELSIQAPDRTQPRLVLCDDAAALERLRGLSGAERVAALVEAGGLTIEFTTEPAWAGAAIEESFGVPRVPLPERRVEGRVAPVVTQDLVLAAALLTGVVAFADLGGDGVAEAEVEAASLRVKARVGPTPVDPSSLEDSGLTPVRAGGAPGAAREEGAEAPLSPEELATPVQAAASPSPAPADVSPPVEAAAPALAPAPPPAADRREGGEGWLAKAWRAIGSSLQRDQAPAAAKPAPAVAAPPKPPSQPAPKRPPPTRRAPPAAVPEAPPDPAVPFAAFARALRIAVPVEPPPVPLAEHEAELAFAAQLAAAASAREHFVSFPAVAIQIIELVRAPGADARGVAGFISRDPGLAADVLAVANSAAFRGLSEAGSVREAVARLGLQEVGRVASAITARALLVPAPAAGAVPSTTLFTRAVAVATAASATALRLRGAHSDQVWLAGLLHDVGLALGASALHGLATGGGLAVPGPVAQRVVERAHVEIGAAALRAWGLPQYLADVCARHHAEELPGGPELVDLHLVRLTSALARLAEPEVGARAAREILGSARALGFDASAVRALAADLKAAEQRAAVLVR